MAGPTACGELPENPCPDEDRRESALVGACQCSRSVSRWLKDARNYGCARLTVSSVDIPLTRESPLILLADDFDDALEIYGTFLEISGYRVVTARDGREAVDVARRARPALIFMDLSMPRMKGSEALAVLRADPSFGSVPIVALTAHALESERTAALLAGFDDVIAKPCLPDELVAAAARLLGTAGKIEPSP